MAMKSRVTIKTDLLPEVLRAVRRMTKKRVLVGVPDSTTDRSPEPGEPSSTMNNATLAYIHDNGSPAANIPARPFLRPGIEDNRQQIVKRMKQIGKKALDGDQTAVERGLGTVGMECQNSVRRKITTGPFAPLAASTIRARRRKRKTRNNEDIRPLIDTGKMRESITYVVRETK